MIYTSIIIPTYNGAHKILNVLQALERQSVKDFEVVVVIDGSSDGTSDLLRSRHFDLPELVVVEQHNGGRSVSRNAGAQRARGTTLIFFDDDMRPVEDCVQHHLDHHAELARSIMVGSQIEDLQAVKTDIQKYKGYLSRLWEEPLLRHKGCLGKENLFLTAANFSISRDLFFELKGFDERLTDAEDFDLAVRALKAGIPIFFNPKAIGWHDDFITCKSYIKRQIQYRKAHSLLKQLKPELYSDFNNHQFADPGLLKKVFFYAFSFSFWQYSMDHFNWLLVFPRFIRYKLYSYIITARSLYFPMQSGEWFKAIDE